MKILVAAPIVLMLTAGLSRAATGLAFLKIAPEAASAALGENAAGGWRNALSPVLNPALAPLDQRWHISLNQTDWIFDTSYLALGFQAPLRKWSLGADLRVLSSTGFELRPDANPEPQGDFRVDDLAVGLNASAPLGQRLRVGAALRRIEEKIYNQASLGWTTDLGLRWEKPVAVAEEASGLLGLSLAARNLGYSSEFPSEAPEPPRAFSLGGEWRGPLPLAGWPGGLQAELRHLQDDGTHLHLGAELLPAAGLVLRGGWMSGYNDRGATLGLGFAWRGLMLDYAWLPFSNALEDVHRFTFSFAL